MPVPESYASRRYSGRDESYSTYSQTRSATRPGMISPSFTSKLASATLPPRPSFERKSSVESSSSRYFSGSRTIPSYGTPSLRGSASPARATTTVLRRDVPSVSDRIKSYDSGEKEFVSRFLRPRETSVTSSLGVKSNAYLLSRERSNSRDSGYSSSFLGPSSAFPAITSRERERNVRGNIAARAASIGPSALSRSSRNGHSSISEQSSTEVTSKSNMSSTTSSANVSRGATPPKRNHTAPPLQNNASRSNTKVGGNKCNNVSNRNDAHAQSVATGSATIDANGDLGQGVNENEGKRKESVKMVTEIDSNGNSMIGDGEQSHSDNQTSPGVSWGSTGGHDSGQCKTAQERIFHKVGIKVGNTHHETHENEKCHNNTCDSVNNACANIDEPPENSHAHAQENTSKQNGMTKKVQRKNSGTPTFDVGHPSPKLPPDVKETKDDGSALKRVLPTLKYQGRQQSASPVRQVTPKLRTPSPAPTTASGGLSRSRESATSISVNRKNSDGNTILLESKGSLIPSSSTSTGIAFKNRPSAGVLAGVSAGVPSASREPSLSRSPSPQYPAIPRPPPLPDLHLNGGQCELEMKRTKNDDKKVAKQRPGPSTRAPGATSAGAATSDSSDNDGDNYTSSPTLGGRFRSSRDKNTDYEKEAGLSGLRNIGNTCFMNSVLQCLSNTKPLLEYIVRKNYTGDINTSTSSMKGALMRAFADLCHELWRDSKSTVDTSAFKDQVQKFAPRFMGYSQQDAQEFLRYLLEGLHEDINRVDTKPPPILTEIDDSLSDSTKATQSWKRYLRCDDSKIVDLFVGQLKSSLKCTTCGHCSVTFDPFWDLSLPIPSKTGQVKLSQCLELFTKEEVLDGDEKPTCSKCTTRRKCTKSFSIQKFPKILVIHLKRFSPTERYRGKLSTTVDFPLTGLDMTSYAASRSTGCVYNLYGVANHSGSTYSGHYVAYCKHPYTADWHCYNDSRVSPISSQSVVSSDGYLLFYELANTSSE